MHDDDPTSAPAVAPPAAGTAPTPPAPGPGAPGSSAPPSTGEPGPAPDMAALMVRLAEIRREVEGTPTRRSGRAWAWALGAAIGLLLAPLLFGKGACLP